MSPERTVGTYAATGWTGFGRLIPSSSRRCSGDAIADLLLAGSVDGSLAGVLRPRPHAATATPPLPAAGDVTQAYRLGSLVPKNRLTSWIDRVNGAGGRLLSSRRP